MGWPLTQKQVRVPYCPNAERDFRTRERRRPSLGIIQWGRKNGRNPNVPTCEDLHQQWTQHSEEEYRIAAWRLHNIIYRTRGTYQETKDTFFKNKDRYGAVSQKRISHEEREFIADSAASIDKQNKTLFMTKKKHFGDRKNLGRFLQRVRFGHVYHNPFIGSRWEI